MNLMIAILSIIIITSLMVLAIHVRAQNRDNANAPLSPKDHDGNDQRCNNADNISKDRAGQSVASFRDTDM